jgi:hypothetical protein
MENMGASGIVSGGLEYVYAAYTISFLVLGGYALLTLVWSRQSEAISRMDEEES